ncbi:MAG: hypothetical protein U0790_03715 [Isosphaeraceae bacterium]
MSFIFQGHHKAEDKVIECVHHCWAANGPAPDQWIKLGALIGGDRMVGFVDGRVPMLQLTDEELIDVDGGGPSRGITAGETVAIAVGTLAASVVFPSSGPVVTLGLTVLAYFY